MPDLIPLTGLDAGRTNIPAGGIRLADHPAGRIIASITVHHPATGTAEPPSEADYLHWETGPDGSVTCTDGYEAIVYDGYLTAFRMVPGHPSPAC